MQVICTHCWAEDFFTVGDVYHVLNYYGEVVIEDNLSPGDAAWHFDEEELVVRATHADPSSALVARFKGVFDE